MEMIKKKTIFLAGIVLLTSAMLAIDVNPSTGPYYVGQEIGFRGSSFLWTYDPGILHFGDGSTATGVTNYTWTNHIYRSPGRYLVRLLSTSSPNSGRNKTQTTMPTPESMYITIRENRYIQATPANPVAGQRVTFQAFNFLTPDDVLWIMGDGTTYRHHGRASPKGGSIVTHTFTQPGSYVVKAYDSNGNVSYRAVELNINIGQPTRMIQYHPETPRVDQPVYLEALNFVNNGDIRWNYGDGTQEVNGNLVMHRFQREGLITVSAVDGSIGHPPVTAAITVLPENRFITVSAPEVLANNPITATAQNFRGDVILWNWGDGNQESAGHQVSHTYSRPGNYTITARDENGESQKPFTATVVVRGIDDEVLLEIAEIRLDNGKYYKVVPRNSKSIFAILRMKMRGTGIVSGRWLFDGNPFEIFNEVAYQGELREIRTRETPGLPTLDPGMHTVTLELTRPSDVNIVFPVLKYYVLPYENTVELESPVSEFVAKEREIPEFSWKKAKGGIRYQITFSNHLYPIVLNTKELEWQDAGIELSYTPTPDVWRSLRRNRWTYWRVRALDGLDQVVAESDVREFKVIVATAEIAINRVSDLLGNPVNHDDGTVRSKADHLLVNGHLKYDGNSKFLVMRVYVGRSLTDQLVFRDVKKGEIREFETSIPHNGDDRVLFQLLKTSSPAVVVGLSNLRLKR